MLYPLSYVDVMLDVGFEPTTPGISDQCSTTELIQQSGPDWNRTSDTRIFSPLLYQLSYQSIKRPIWDSNPCLMRDRHVIYPINLISQSGMRWSRTITIWFFRPVLRTASKLSSQNISSWNRTNNLYDVNVMFFH